jgi:hypothetical protein
MQAVSKSSNPIQTQAANNIAGESACFYPREMGRTIDLSQCLWVQGANVEKQMVFHPTVRELNRRGAKAWLLGDCSAQTVERLRERVWKSDEHVILQGLLGREMRALYPIFRERKNFSVVLIDWWNSPFWYSRNATYVIFHNYSGIAVRTGRARFVEAGAPWLLKPDVAVRYPWISALLRVPALAVAPILEPVKAWQRAHDTVDASRLMYFPLPVAAENVPLKPEPPTYDFTSLGATLGPWIMRDAYASAWLNFGNLYADRQRLIDLIDRLSGHPFSVFDRRRHFSFLPWEELCRIIRQSRFALCTGGLQRSSIPKYLEYVCMGIPILGSTLPFEYPWLDGCVYTVDAMKVTLAELKPKLNEALELQPRLKENCLAARDIVLAQYEAGRLLDILQDQIDGKPVPPGYLKV